MTTVTTNSATAQSPTGKPAGTELRVDRRALLIGTGLAAAGVAALPFLRRALGDTAATFIARNQRYDGPLVSTIREGLVATGFDPAWVRGKRVLLKPNLVEPTRRSPQMTTHPAVVVAAAEAFRGWGATVTVGEGPGHVRDTEMALVESGMHDALAGAGLEFNDLNYSPVGWVPNAGRATALEGFYFPRQVIEADLIVSMPKMKTHHWVGYTGALKNLYGVIPGIKYGWPKNVLHYAGIPQSIFDINASLPKTVAIVDGIVAMEGDGPIMGSAKPMGLLVVGINSTGSMPRWAGSWASIQPGSRTCNWPVSGWVRSTKARSTSGARRGKPSPAHSSSSTRRSFAGCAARWSPSRAV
jgi:uncharacterized protein (DUF362 family)